MAQRITRAQARIVAASAPSSTPAPRSVSKTKRHDAPPKAQHTPRWNAEQVTYVRLKNSGLMREGQFANPQIAAKKCLGVQSQEVLAGFLSLWNRVKLNKPNEKRIEIGVEWHNERVQSGTEPTSIRKKGKRKVAKIGKEQDQVPLSTSSHKVPAPWKLSDMRHFVQHDHSLVRVWGKRGTLHLYHREDWDVINSCVGEHLMGLIQNKFPNGEVDEAVSRALEQLQSRNEEDCLTHLELATKDQVIRHRVHMMLTLRGLACRVEGGIKSRKVAMKARSFVAALSERKDITQEDAMIDGAMRYFDTFGPASCKDFQYYFGAKVKPANKAFKYLADSGLIVPITVTQNSEDKSVSGTVSKESQQVNKQSNTKRKKIRTEEPEEVLPEWLVSQPLYVLSDHCVPPSCPARDEWDVMLLGRFETTLLAHKDKHWLLDPEVRQLVWRKFAEIVACVVAHGRVCAVWKHAFKKMPDSGKQLVINIEPFPTAFGGELVDDATVRSKLSVRAAELAAF